MGRPDDRVLSDRAWLATLTAGALVLAAGVVAGACALLLDELGAGGRAVCAALGAWGLAVGTLGLRAGLTGRPRSA